MQENLNIDDIVRVDTLPVIFQQLELVGTMIDKELESVKDLQATEENKQEVKKVRTNINNTLKIFEDKRKTIKTQILEPYNKFNEKYENEIKNKLENASNTLKTQIDEIESKQIEEKKNEIKDFVDEHLISNHLENILDFDQVEMYAGLKLNLSTSIKSLKEQALNFIGRVANEIKLIDMEEQPSDLLFEYQQNGFNLTNAKLTLIERNKMIEELSKQREQELAKIEEEVKVEEIVEQITTPKEIIEEDKEVECTFTIKTTMSKLKELKVFMKEREIEIL